jgi:hypothetical protein
MLVALSRFTIANGMADEVRAAFRHRPHLVDSAPGFLGMEVMSPLGDTAEIWLVTRWCGSRATKRGIAATIITNRTRVFPGVSNWCRKAPPFGCSRYFQISGSRAR